MYETMPTGTYSKDFPMVDGHIFLNRDVFRWFSFCMWVRCFEYIYIYIYIYIYKPIQSWLRTHKVVLRNSMYIKGQTQKLHKEESEKLVSSGWQFKPHASPSHRERDVSNHRSGHPLFLLLFSESLFEKVLMLVIKKPVLTDWYKYTNRDWRHC